MQSAVQHAGRYHEMKWPAKFRNWDQMSHGMSYDIRRVQFIDNDVYRLTQRECDRFTRRISNTTPGLMPLIDLYNG